MTVVSPAAVASACSGQAISLCIFSSQAVRFRLIGRLAGCRVVGTQAHGAHARGLRLGLGQVDGCAYGIPLPIVLDRGECYVFSA